MILFLFLFILICFLAAGFWVAKWFFIFALIALLAGLIMGSRNF